MSRTPDEVFMLKSVGCYKRRLAVPRRSAFAVLVCLLLTGCKALPPGKVETAVIARAKHKLLVRGASAKNPLAANEENIKGGQQTFAQYCVACHGLDGQNTGVPFADRVSPPVPSLASKDIQSYSDGQLKWVIDNGIWPSGMPGSKGILNDEEIWSTVLYIRHLPPPGTLGEPCIYTGGDCAPSSEKPRQAVSQRHADQNQ
jgi:mono/diheme cytochrome c family protein